jgi:hypothetical protein
MEADHGLLQTLQYLEKLQTERQRSRDTVLPEGMTEDSLNDLIGGMKRRLAEREQAGGKDETKAAEPLKYKPPEDKELEGMGIQSARVKRLADKWRKKAK